MAAGELGLALPGPCGWLLGFLDEAGEPVPLLGVGCAATTDDGLPDWACGDASALGTSLWPRGLTPLGVYSDCAPPEAAARLAKLLGACAPRLPALADAERSGSLLCAATGGGGAAAFFRGGSFAAATVAPEAERRARFAATHLALRARLAVSLSAPPPAGVASLVEELRSRRLLSGDDPR